MNKMNKWTLNFAHKYFVGDQEVTRTHCVAIPPTSGDRVDVIGTSGKHYYGMTKKKWNKRMTPEDYLDQNLKTDKEERAKALKKIDWTPKVINDEIELVIVIKSGKIELKAKL